MLYFAYGSNLDPAQMAQRCPGHHVVGMAALHDHRMDFPRFSETWGGGVSGPVHAHGQQIWGVVFELTDDHIAELDRYEGFHGAGDQHNAYDRLVVTVDLVRADDGSVPRRVRAYTYFARAANPSPPSRRYMDTLLRGARHHRLPDDYVEGLGKVEASEAEGGP